MSYVWNQEKAGSQHRQEGGVVGIEAEDAGVPEESQCLGDAEDHMRGFWAEDFYVRFLERLYWQHLVTSIALKNNWRTIGKLAPELVAVKM